jgi:pimeloyl-ACP methyl ester carboxylesterase
VNAAVIEGDLDRPDGRVVHWYDTGEPAGVKEPLVVYWHHGTPNIGAPPAPLFPAGESLGVRWISHDRPGYGGSTPQLGRRIVDVVADVLAITEFLGVQQFSAMGHSGGGPHALACAAELPERVRGVVVASGLAPYGAEGLDWFAGMSDEGPLRAALAGREAKEAYEAAAHDGVAGFIPADWAILDGAWAWFGSVVEPALASGPGPLIDDDLSYVAPWGFDVPAVKAPVLLLHGESDGVVPAAHAEWLARRLRDGELWLRPEDGHISVLAAAPAALGWLAGQRPRGA